MLKHQLSSAEGAALIRSEELSALRASISSLRLTSHGLTAMAIESRAFGAAVDVIGMATDESSIIDTPLSLLIAPQLMSGVLTFIEEVEFNMKALVLSLLISLPCFSPSYEATSTMRCFTEPKSVRGALKNSTAVFAGEVLEIWKGVNFRQARFRVERSWKGVEADEVFVTTDETAETPHYQVGEKYLVFAGIRNDKLFTGSCSRTKRLEYGAGDLQQLGKGKLHRKAE